MKVVALRDAKQELSRYVREAQTERIMITNHGRPAAIVIGISGLTHEQAQLASDPEFWALIQSRRGESTSSLADVRKRLDAATAKRPARAKSPRKRRSATR